MAMARFRIVLGHLYAEVDGRRALEMLRRPVQDLDLFAERVREGFAEELSEQRAGARAG